MKAYNEAVERLARAKGFKPEKRPLLEEAFHLATSSPSPFLILQAPTGYGKTLLSFSLAIHSLKDASLFDRVIHVLPMRSIIEDIQRTVDEAFGFSRTKMMGSSGEFLHLFPLNITTADTFTWDILKLNTKKRGRVKAGREFGYDYLTQASILTSLVIFDEAHFLLEDESMITAFMAVLEFLTSQRVPVVVMTATLACAHVKLFERYAKRNGYEFHVLLPDENDPFIQREFKKEITIELNSGNPFDFVEPGRKNAIIVNSVGRAVKLYDEALERSNLGFEKDRIMLIHGRMTPSHKRELIGRLREWKREGSFLLIGTQAVEAGVDFSVDVMVTDGAPINSLLQRFGRVARYEGERNARITVLEDAPKGPYPKEKVEKTIELMIGKTIHPRVPKTYQEIVTEVHGKSASSLNKAVNRILKGTLVKLMGDPTKRSRDVLAEVERLTVKGVSILRGFLVPVSVGKETVLVSPKKLLELYSASKVELRGWNRELTDLNGAYKVAKAIALGQDVEVVFTGEYDRERGIV
ncbi:CRISPR-associated helicase Cas3' [Thermococcus atlanticus]